jgi:hypothetical protein
MLNSSQIERDIETRQAELGPGESEEEIKQWLHEVKTAKRREKSWRKEARDLVAMYEASKGENAPFNILYANVETIAPTLYNALPRPVVRPKNLSTKSDASAIAAKVTERVLAALIDPGSSEYPGLDELAEKVVIQALVIDRGVLRFKYDSDSTPMEEVVDEICCGELVNYDRFCHGFGRTWKEVPWIAFEHYLHRSELASQFGDLGLAVSLSEVDSGASVDEQSSSGEAGEEKEQLGHVIELWNKETREVLFFSPGLPGHYLRRVMDPLTLTGFFPTPEPLHFSNPISSLLPIPMYRMYKEQAEELNSTTRRIHSLIKAIRVRGAYDTNVQDLDKILNANENELIPVDGLAAAGAGQGSKALENSLYIVPIEKWVQALQQLREHREAVKQVIYEILGVADILRGSSRASETATAQGIKDKWGALRIKRSQRRVMNYLRSCLRIMAEIALEHFSPQTIFTLADVQLPTEAEKQQQALMAQQQSMGGGGPVPGMPSVGTGPTGPVPPPPSIPTQEEVVKILKSDFIRSYMIDIETNSTIDADATEDKQNISELMNALAQFLNGVQPLLDKGVMSFDVAKTIMIAVVRRFRFGPEIEEELKQMSPPQEKADPKVEADKAKMQGEMQMAAEEHKLKMAEMQAELEFKKKEFEMKIQMMQMELQHKQQLLTMQLQGEQQKAAAAMQTKQMELALGEREHEQAMAQGEQSHQQSMAHAEAAAAAEPKDTE